MYNLALLEASEVSCTGSAILALKRDVDRGLF